MGWWNRREYPVEQIRQWIAEGKTQQWIAEQLDSNAKLIQKVCKKHGIKCQRTGPRSGEGHTNWQGGVLIDKHGYRLVYCPGHPHARLPRRVYVCEHRLVMEQHLGRYLLPNEVVHHKDGDRANNSLENLEVYSSNAEHLKADLKGRVPNWTEEGKVRIQLGVQQAIYNRSVSKRGECQNIQSGPRSTE